MKEDNFDSLFQKWIDKEIDNYKRGKRRYLHFDQKINIEQKAQFFKSFFFIPDNILRHSFYPFIKSDIVTKKFKRVSDEINADGKPLRRKQTKVRPIAYSSHFDSAIYLWYSTVLSDKYVSLIKDLRIEDCVLAYLEKGLCNINFADNTFSEIRKRSNSVVMTFDISSFFDGIDHKILFRNWCKVLQVDKLPKDHFKIYQTLTSYTFVEKKVLEEIFPLSFFRKKTVYIKLIEFALANSFGKMLSI